MPTDDQDRDLDDLHPLADLMPTDPLLVPFWCGSLQYALSRDDWFEAFQRDTGLKWTPARTPLDRMIDESSGADLARLRAFIQWHNVNIWGDLDLVAGGGD